MLCIAQVCLLVLIQFCRTNTGAIQKKILQFKKKIVIWRVEFTNHVIYKFEIGSLEKKKNSVAKRIFFIDLKGSHS